MHPARPDVLSMQKHWDVMRSDNGGEHFPPEGKLRVYRWEPIVRDLPAVLSVEVQTLP